MHNLGFTLKVTAILVLLMLLVAACGQGTIEDVQVGTPAPGFSLQAAGGGKHRLQDLREQIVILSFLNTQAEVTVDNADMSRSQVVFLRSMAEQYGPKGVHVLIVDATGLVTGQPATEDALINYSYDWHLETIPVLMDRGKSRTANAYGVTQVPTIFLIDGEGIVQQRWESFASAQDLAFALQELIGKPAHD